MNTENQTPELNLTVEDIKLALANNEFEPFFQPICNTQGQIIGAEALARWLHPQLGVITADRFIAIAEENGLAAEISRHMIIKACEYQQELSAAGYDVPVSLNLSPQQLSDDTLPHKLAEILDEKGCLPRMISFELTEYSALACSQKAVEILRRIREMGHDIYMDDVGDGHNNVELLNLLVEGKVLKGIKFSRETLVAAFDNQEKKSTILQAFKDFINRNILSGIKIADKATLEAYQDQTKQAELQEIINYAKENGLSVTLEGVEQGMIAFALQMQCDRMQGYAFAKPMTFLEYKRRLVEVKAIKIMQKINSDLNLLTSSARKSIMFREGNNTALGAVKDSPKKPPENTR